MNDTHISGLLCDREWLAAIALLSLDITRPFYAAMGFQMPKAEIFQTLLRGAIQERPLGFVLFRPREQDLVSIKTVMDGVVRVNSSAHALALETWVQTIFRHQDPRWHLYERTLIRWQNKWRKSGEDSFGLAAIPNVVQALDLLRSQDDAKAMLASTRGTWDRNTMSSWDDFMFNLGLYINGPELALQINGLWDSVRVRDPFESIGWAIKNNQLQLFWEVMLEESGPKPLKSLHDAAQQQISDPLPHPGEFRRKLLWPSVEK